MLLKKVLPSLISDMARSKMDTPFFMIPISYGTPSLNP